LQKFFAKIPNSNKLITL